MSYENPGQIGNDSTPTYPRPVVEILQEILNGSLRDEVDEEIARVLKWVNKNAVASREQEQTILEEIAHHRLNHGNVWSFALLLTTLRG